ncbi:MAG: SDR family oxidoreductase [Rhodospirillaceae bacterium]
MATQGHSRDVVVLSGKRTGFGTFGGSLKDFTATDLGVFSSKAAIEAAAKGSGRVFAIPADVSTAEGCERAYAAAVDAMGQVDVLVNNAGSSARMPFAEVSDELWQSDLDLKLFAAIRLCRLAVPPMRARKWGRVINVLNTGAKAPPAQGAPTAVTRAAGMALTKVMAAEAVVDNVLVNALLVGRIESDQWERRHAAENKGRALADFYAEMGKGLPLGRLGTAEEFANAACFLASEQGSYIAGVALNVDGGLSPVV